jgi:hypothetical protein
MSRTKSPTILSCQGPSLLKLFTYSKQELFINEILNIIPLPAVLSMHGLVQYR